MTRRDPTAGIHNVHKQKGVSYCLKRIDKVGWARFLREQIEEPTIIWTQWDPVEELAKWEADKQHPQDFGPDYPDEPPF